MAILEESGMLTYPVEDFSRTLDRASLGVVLLYSSRLPISEKGNSFHGIGNAWLITDELAVTPNYRFRHDAVQSYHCQLPREDDRFYEAKLVTDMQGAANPTSPVLLRLSESLPDRALTLATYPPFEGDSVFILHYPRGIPELQISFGTMRFGYEEQWGVETLRYDADTEKGSGGAPIFNSSWELVGMHLGADPRSGPSYKPSYNWGLPLSAILESLRATAYWTEIARYHNLADFQTPAIQGGDKRPPPPLLDKGLKRAAVQWSFDPASFSPEEREQLQESVIDTSHDRWILRANERKRLIDSADSLVELKQARGKDSEDDLRQGVIDRILEGPPYELSSIDDGELPYWLQAVRWFADMEPALPTPKEINDTLERRRVRGRLRSVAGPDFRGRDDELERLHRWYASEELGPVMISGIGGIGKSALVAKFALQLDEKTPILWLDFDRADIAPDDAYSVLRLLSEQMAVQVTGFAGPTIDAQKPWQEQAEAFGRALAEATAGESAPLLVLDGFEVAQYVQRYQEIWRLLELILEQAPQLRVLVSGRDRVVDLTLDDRSAESLELAGLARQETKMWLEEGGIDDANVVEKVLDAAKGVPLVLLLVLQLAAQLIEEGEDIVKLLDKLPQTLVEGFLYQRILNRIIDRQLKPLAQDALVLRRLTVEIIAEILKDKIPEEMDAGEVFARLTRELALVRREDSLPGIQEGPALVFAEGGVLQLRPEVRSATLKLLEAENLSRVQEIDARVADWYEKQDLDSPVNAAELIYHRLRLGDIVAAQKAWLPDCAPLLEGAETDLADEAEAERAWLRERLSELVFDISAWEADAFGRIRTNVERRHYRGIAPILNEHAQRSADSPLLFYDAWTLWQDGELEEARAILASDGDIKGAAGRDRTVLAANLALLAGDRVEARRLLRLVAREDWWLDWRDGLIGWLAVQAALIQLTSELESELALVDLLNHEARDPDDPNDGPLVGALRRFLPLSDVLLPILAERMEVPSPLEAVFTTESIPIPVDVTDFELFKHQLEEARHRTLVEPGDLFLSLDSGDPSPPAGSGSESSSPSEPVEEELAKRLEKRFPDASEVGLNLGKDIAMSGLARWRMVSENLFLARACELASEPRFSDSLQIAIAGTLVLFLGIGRKAGALQWSDQDLDVILERMIDSLSGSARFVTKVRRVKLMAQIVRQMGDVDPTAEETAGKLEQLIVSEEGANDDSRNVNVPVALIQNFVPHELRSLNLYVFGSYPLNVLSWQVFGLTGFI